MQQREITFKLVGTEFVNHETGVKIVPVGTGWRAVRVTQDGTQIGINVVTQDYDIAKHDACGYIINVERFWRRKDHAEALEIDAKRHAMAGWTKVGRKHWRHDETGIEISRADGQWDVYPLTKTRKGCGVMLSWHAWSSRSEAVEAAGKVEIPAAWRLIADDEADAHAEAFRRFTAHSLSHLPPPTTPRGLDAALAAVDEAIKATGMQIGKALYGVDNGNRPQPVLAPQLHRASSPTLLTTGGARRAIELMRDLLLVMPDEDVNNVAKQVAEELGVEL